MNTRLLLLLFVLIFSKAEAQRIAPDVLPTGKGPLTVQPIVHASLVLSATGLTICADPTGGAATYTGIKPPHMILITDIHGDHFDVATIAAVKTPSTLLIVPQAVA